MERKRKILPPIYLLLTLAVMVALDRWLPMIRWIGSPWRHAGWLLVVTGFILAAFSAGRFRRAGTPVVPFERSTVLVTAGAFRFTRNPMYLGMVLLLAGIAVVLGSVGAALPVPVFVWIIHSWFILGEERFLEEIFGEPYLAYKSRVRRWL